MDERGTKRFTDITRVKRCADCKGTGIAGRASFLDQWEPIRCTACLGTGQVLYTVRQEIKLEARP